MHPYGVLRPHSVLDLHPACPSGFVRAQTILPFDAVHLDSPIRTLLFSIVTILLVGCDPNEAAEANDSGDGKTPISNYTTTHDTVEFESRPMGRCPQLRLWLNWISLRSDRDSSHGLGWIPGRPDVACGCHQPVHYDLPRVGIRLKSFDSVNGGRGSPFLPTK